MNQNFSYYMPTKIVFGINELENISKYIDGRKTLLIISNGFVKRGLVEKLRKLDKNIVSVFSDVKSHPEFKDLELAYELIHKNEFELILAIGGGSILDASKYFSVYNSKKESNFVTNLIKGNIEKKDYKTIPIISIPTTAGTGSEITPWATIWDMDDKKKYSLHLPELFSKVAIYDPILTLSVPKDITIQTGLDTLSHALESIWNKNANPITINYAIKSAKLIMKYLPLLANDLERLEYRTEILKACMYAGLAFSNTQTAIAHAMSYYITVNKGIPHGIACSFTLPMLIDNVIGKYEFIDKALIEIFGELSSNSLREILEKLNTKTEFEDYGLSKDEIEELKNSLENNQRTLNSLVNVENTILKISVIVPVFNTEKYLKKCLNSIINQTFKNIEIIIIDDGSTDGSLEIIRKYQNQYTNIRLFETKNIGSGAARNIGIRNSKADYITFIDSDDSVEVNMLQELYNEARYNNSDMVFSKYQKVYEYSDKLYEPLPLTYTKHEILKNLITFNLPSFMWRILYNKELFFENNLFFIEKNIYNEDTYLLLRLVHKAKSISFVDKVFYYWLTREGSKTNSISEKHIEDITFVLKENLDYILDNNIEEISISDILFGIFKSLNFRVNNIQDKINLGHIGKYLKVLNNKNLEIFKDEFSVMYYDLLFNLKRLYSIEEITSLSLFLKIDLYKISKITGDKFSMIIDTISYIYKKYDRKIYIYGAGEVCFKIISQIPKYMINGIIDKNYKKKLCENFILSDKNILKHNDIIFIASFTFAKDIRVELEAYSLENNITLYIYDSYSFF
ncbi:iron-containing alcohol dehydrogenase [Arcobacter lanthieri]|uniref:iron-containing alcohol dehydrogenase n=1 Tax=Aliarcobacter lanthieri TaxID=1355374 RepID=UPI00192394E3|nr:iron-containing alcohol dehydrogenase [Aliarcobacter lanthieri]MBL3519175.1 iron-containing alcohol dehydrogenase [Aliarcobacter lanthieri]